MSSQHTGCLIAGCQDIIQTTTRHDHLFPGGSGFPAGFLKLHSDNRVANEFRFIVFFFLFRQYLESVISYDG